MASGPVRGLLGQLVHRGLLTPSQIEQIRTDVAPHCADARALAAELVRRQWLTTSQANLLLQGKAKEMVVDTHRTQEQPAEPLIARKLASAAGGNWGWAAPAWSALVLLGGVVAYWIFRQPNYEPSTGESVQPLASTNPSPRAEPTPVQNSKPEPKELSKTKPPAPAPTPQDDPKPGRIANPPAAQDPAQPQPAAEVAKPKDPRRPVPEEAAVAKTRAGIRDLYKDDYQKIKHSEMSALAERLLADAGNANDDAVTLYVLLGEARDVAARAADAELAFRAIDELAARFALDGRPLKITALERSVREARTPERSLLLADMARDLLEEALSADHYGEAVHLAKLAENAALRSGDRALMASTTTRRRDIEYLQKTFEELKPSLAVLADKPDDADANLAVGRFLCLLKGDWTRGLPHLVQGSDAPLRDLARMELGGIGNPQQEAELADGWRNQARKERGLARHQVLVHALTTLQRVLPDLVGPAKLKAEKSVAQIEKELPNEYHPEVPGARFKGRWLVPYGTRRLREYAIDNKGNVQFVRESTVDAAGNVINPREVNRSTKVIKQGADYLLDFEDGSLERLSMKSGNLVVEHFEPKALYPKGRPSIVATSVRKPGG